MASEVFGRTGVSDAESVYCEITYGGEGNVEVISNLQGFRGFELGEPADSTTSVSGARGVFAVVDNYDTYVFKNASCSCIEGSKMHELLLREFGSGNYGSDKSITFVKNKGKFGNCSKSEAVYRVRCVKTSGVRSGWDVTGNGDTAAIIRFGLEVQQESLGIE